MEMRRRGSKSFLWTQHVFLCNRLGFFECLNEYWFVSLGHVKTIIEAWRQEYNNERPKKALGGLTPAAYARQLAEVKTVSSATGL